MGQESRKASDVLLDLETKIGTLLDIVRAQDLNIKVLSNKLNDVIGQLKQQQQAAPPRITAETIPMAVPPAMPTGFSQLPAGDPERNIPIQGSSSLPQTNSPQGFRRTSRPETFANDPKRFSGDDAYLQRNNVEEIRMPVQMPRTPLARQGQVAPPPGRSEAVAPPANKAPPTNNRPTQMDPSPPEENYPASPMVQGQIPTMQRVVNKNGKSIFLAEVEITDLSTGKPVFKTKTNGAGKWMASLVVGSYRVKITKRATSSINNEAIEATQDIQVDGSQKPLDLPMLIIK